MRALFICGKAQRRSPTAAQVFATWDGVHTDFGGVSRDADDVLSSDQLDWADQIFVMEQRYAKRLAEEFQRSLRGKRVINLAIRDEYRFMDPHLIEALIQKAGPHLRQGRKT
ncbi:MAG: phosphotyrosine protein phosphatase [Pseudomonadota bacterium]